MNEYTVVGLLDDNGTLLVAAVLLGNVPLEDNASESGEFQRFATTVLATDSDDAEQRAQEEVEN